jgi:hypothetical protein
MTKLAFHEKLFGAYVYDYEGEILRFRVFANQLEAEAWARRKASENPWSCNSSRGAWSLKTETFGPLPWCVHVFTEATGSIARVHGEVSS